MTSSQNGVSRRSVAKGAAWAAPVIAIGAATPAASASPVMCSADSKAAIDTAFANALNMYQCNGAKPVLAIDFSQPGEALDGWGSSVWTNVSNMSSCSIAFTPQNPLRLHVEYKAYTNIASSRSQSGVVTSWGTLDVTEFDGTQRHLNESEFGVFGVKPGPITANTTFLDFLWNFGKTMPANQTADMKSDFGGDGTKKFYIVATPLATSGAPTLDSIALAAGQAAACQSYYDTKLAEFAATGGPIQWAYKRWSTNYPQTNTVTNIAAGTPVSSLTANNLNTGGGLMAYGKNGIF